MIYFEDHLDKDTHSDDSFNELFSSKNNTEECEILSFPIIEQNEVSREEIGKWVDKVMGLHAESNVENYVNESTAETDDPCFQLADLFISNDLI